jgi:hypothetical protein
MAKKEEIIEPQGDLGTLLGYIEGRLKDMLIFADDEEDDKPVLQRTYKIHGAEVPVMVVAGINASGKSIVADVVATSAKKCGFGRRAVTMKNRTTSGFERAMIFGDENDESTGVNSVSAVLKGVKSSKQDNGPSVLILDEPDIGLSEEYSGALGEYLAAQVIEADHNLKLLVVISHSRPLYRRMLEVLPYEPHSVYMGDNTKTFSDWLNGPVPRFGADEIEKLKARGLATWRAINSVVKG